MAKASLNSDWTFAFYGAAALRYNVQLSLSQRIAALNLIKKRPAALKRCFEGDRHNYGRLLQHIGQRRSECVHLLLFDDERRRDAQHISGSRARDKAPFKQLAHNAARRAIVL